jgi:hypothetical protein
MILLLCVVCVNLFFCSNLVQIINKSDCRSVVIKFGIGNICLVIFCWRMGVLSEVWSKKRVYTGFGIALA